MLEINMNNPEKHCKRSTGTDRAWFRTHEEAVAFANDPANTTYHGDIAHFCASCGFFHLSKPEWHLNAPRTRHKSAEDYILMMATESEQQDYLSLAYAVMLPNEHAKLVHHCDVNRLADLSRLLTEGGTVFAALAIVNLPGYGVFGCSKLLQEVPGGAKLISDELQIMKNMLKQADWARYITPEIGVIQ